eukprot:9470369-Pyramimonas_sp.AAC.1
MHAYMPCTCAGPSAPKGVGWDCARERRPAVGWTCARDRRSPGGRLGLRAGPSAGSRLPRGSAGTARETVDPQGVGWNCARD